MVDYFLKSDIFLLVTALLVLLAFEALEFGLKMLFFFWTLLDLECLFYILYYILMGLAFSCMGGF